MAVVVRAPLVGDADALGHVHVRAWQAAYRGGLMPDDYLDSLSTAERASMWRGWLHNPPRPRSTRLVGVVDDEVVGFALSGPAGGEKAAEVRELYAINVDPGHWGTGIGSALIDASVAALSDRGFTRAVLWVHPDNGRAGRFYVARGWTPDDVERRQEVLDIEVPETRYSLMLGGEPPVF